ncbi:glutaredoxin family protein [Halopseudomonas salegens]|nr:glutaredoxin family protein [Halopseudomonas salegens]
MSAPVVLTLYGTSACHLCDAAMSALEPLKGNGVHVHVVDISEDPLLLERYQLRIPVLQRTDNGAELDFPFDLPQVMAWLQDILQEGR